MTFSKETGVVKELCESIASVFSFSVRACMFVVHVYILICKHLFVLRHSIALLAVIVVLAPLYFYSAC